jgi:hypothetical protein
MVRDVGIHFQGLRVALETSVEGLAPLSEPLGTRSVPGARSSPPRVAAQAHDAHFCADGGAVCEPRESERRGERAGQAAIFSRQ